MITKSGIENVSTVIITVVILIFLTFSDSNSCTTLIAGRGTTEDGSILFAKTEDDDADYADYLWFVPRKKHKKGAMIKLSGGNMIPQAAETYAYFWDQVPGSEYSNAVVNEWGLSIGSDACPSREDSIEEVEKRGDISKGGIGWRLRFILAERCKTAREAVQLASELLDRYGYRGSGRTLDIVSPSEAWILQMVRGKQYVARRVKEDEVVPIANTYTIRDVDTDDEDNFTCSDNLIKYAEERGWYNPERDGKFDFAKTYASKDSHTDIRNTRRCWIMAKAVNRDFPLSREEADRGKMPVSIKPDRKLSLKEMMNIMRNHYEGTELDSSNGYERSPHKTESRPICTYYTRRTTVIQLREWMPAEIGTVIWRALYEPCSSGFVPWYLCARDIPKAFRNAPVSFYDTDKSLYEYHFNMPEEKGHLDMDSASYIFGLMAGLVDSDYKNVIDHVKEIWSDFENYQFRMQGKVEETALKLYKRDKEGARNYLSDYTTSRAAESINTAKSIINTLEYRLWNAKQGTRLAPGN
ncbi:MAG: C69 family dipeptidase [Candidatus Krumholzibacteriota bacterium]|nr:C69 family dipeptidase [Candidatus Krumholzibacteriota bacterium]